jgi:hypothetical protein
MRIYDTPAAIAAAPTSAFIDRGLKRLLADRIADWAAAGLLGLTHLLILEPGDTEQAILNEVAFSPLVSTVDGQRWGSPGFEPDHDWLEDHDGWFELVFTVGNDGFAFVLLIPDAADTDPDLLAFCRAYSGR